MGHPGTAPNGYTRLLLPARPSRPSSRRTGTPADDRARGRLHRRLGLRRLDRGLAAGGALLAGRREPQRRGAGARAAQGPHRLPPVDGHRPPLGRLRADPGPGRPDGRSATWSGAARTSTSRPRCARPPRPSSARTGTPPTRDRAACGRRRSAAPRSTPTTTESRRGCGCEHPSWNEVSKSGGIWAAMLDRAGHTCDRVPLAINSGRCVDAKWCYTGCIFGAKNSLITNYLPSAEAAGVRGAAAGAGQRDRPLDRDSLPLRRQGPAHRPGLEGPGRSGRGHRVQGPDPRRRGDGDAADPDALPARGRAALDLLPAGAPPRGQRRPRRGDRVRPGRGAERPRPLLRRLPQGQADHDHELRLVGRQARQRRRRQALHPPGDPALAAHQHPLRRRARRRPVVVGPGEEAEHVHLELAPRDPGDGRGHPRRLLLRRPARRRRPRAAERGPGRDRPLQLRPLARRRHWSANRPTRRSGT